VDGRSQNRIILQLLVLLTKVRGILIVTLGMKRRKEDEHEQPLHTNYRAKVVMGYLVKRSLFLS
jgi:hypothetical protein